MRILVIEDDADAATFMVKGLRAAGHAVDHAIDGKVGNDMAGSGGYDAYVIDRMLPHKDGLTLLEDRRTGGDETANEERRWRNGGD